MTYSEERHGRILQIMRCDNKDFSYGSQEILLLDGPVTLKVEVNRESARFFYQMEKTGWLALGEPQPADHLSDDYIEKRRGRCAFSGAMVGICAQDMDARRSWADFADFIYQEHF